VVASAKRKNCLLYFVVYEKKSFEKREGVRKEGKVYEKKSFGKVVFYASMCTKRREGVFLPSARKDNFVHIKAPLIH
jgi:hypothetical protein